MHDQNIQDIKMIKVLNFWIIFNISSKNNILWVVIRIQYSLGYIFTSPLTPTENLIFSPLRLHRGSSVDTQLICGWTLSYMYK